MITTRFIDQADAHAVAGTLHAAAMPADIRVATGSDPIPPEHRTRFADLAVRGALALMPFSAIAWTFIAH